MKTTPDPLWSSSKETRDAEIERIRISGDLAEVTRIIAAIRDQKDELTKQLLTTLLSDIKKHEMVDILIDQLQVKGNVSVYKELLQACWQSQLDFSKHLTLMVDLFLTQNYGVALEAFTVVETSILEQDIAFEIRHNLIQKIKTVLHDLSYEQKLLAVELIHVLDT